MGSPPATTWWPLAVPAPEKHLRIECRGCGRVVHKDRGPFTDEEKARLKCRHCGAGNPLIEERPPRTPYTKGYRPA